MHSSRLLVWKFAIRAESEAMPNIVPVLGLRHISSWREYSKRMGKGEHSEM